VPSKSLAFKDAYNERNCKRHRLAYNYAYAEVSLLCVYLSNRLAAINSSYVFWPCDPLQFSNLLSPEISGKTFVNISCISLEKSCSL